MTGERSLTGMRIVVTREHPGALARLLEERGATMLHVPTVAVVGPADGGAALGAELDRLDRYDWLIVTSPSGAERVGASAAGSSVRLAAVGAATADTLARLAGRPVDLVPPVQRAAALAAEFESIEPALVLLALADRASGELEAALGAAGHSVTRVTAYRTVAARVSAPRPASADALLLASGSAAESWAAGYGGWTPPIVVAIGPTTADAAREAGLKVDGVAADHSLTGLVAELERRVGAVSHRERGEDGGPGVSDFPPTEDKRGSRG